MEVSVALDPKLVDCDCGAAAAVDTRDSDIAVMRHVDIKDRMVVPGSRRHGCLFASRKAYKTNSRVGFDD